ncbi:aminoglycoside phosphotransferase family protein [Streptacidiphilus melanogenes]|uniref:aminoglycoside phosphotransferase family protein n=1 Tax=Streptacidiphilus melanogenes TaxID=411235 RepID=UPI0005A88BF7|nr:aminoglycoside phosphotransferase family protein [Streptacidiphilus melanogenes]
MGQMHADEADTGVPLVRRLIAEQFPQWARLPVELVDRDGTSNAMFRLGDDMVVRLPRIAGAAEDVQKEHTWLPRLAPQLPVAIPVPLGQGGPGAGYPWSWSVYGWLDGANPVVGRRPPGDDSPLAEDLAAFTKALRAIDPEGGPAAYRSEPLAARDAATRRAVAALDGVIDADTVEAVWEDALGVPEWDGPAVWIHADLQPGNLLVSEGRLTGVIDFGCLGLGDPAVDFMPAWYVLPGAARPVFRAAVGADEASWARARGWALSVALMELQYYRDTNPVMTAVAGHVLKEILAEG